MLTSQHHVKTVASELNLADLLEKAHASLTGVLANQHHAQAHSLASHSTKAHSELTNVLTSDHHVKTTSGEISLASLLEKNHASLSNVLTSQHHVKTTSGEISLASLLEKAHASLTGVLANQHHAEAHSLASHSTKPHSALTGVLTSQHHVKTTSGEISLASLLEKNHASLSNVLTSQHHVKTTSGEISLASLLEKAHASLTGVLANQHHAEAHSLASHSTKAHSELTNVLTSDHHVKTTSGEISLASLLEKAHASLTGVLTSQHHVKYSNANAVSAMGAKADDNPLHHDRPAGISIDSWEIPLHHYADGVTVAAFTTHPVYVFPSADANAVARFTTVYPEWATAMVNPILVFRLSFVGADNWTINIKLDATAVGEAVSLAVPNLYNAALAFNYVGQNNSILYEETVTTTGTLSPGDTLSLMMMKTSLDSQNFYIHNIFVRRP